MKILSESRRPPRRCGACSEGVVVSSDVKGRTFAYRDELELEMQGSLRMQVCTACGEIRLSAADTLALNDALSRTYAARHRAAATEALHEPRYDDVRA